MTNKTNDSNQLSNYREIASAIKKSIEASGRIPPHKSVGGVLYRFLCTVSGNDVTLRSNNWTVADWENSTINASIKYTLTESEHVKWNNVQVAAETLLSQIVFSNKDDIFGLFLKWIKSEKETSMYTPSGFLPHDITETIKTHNESEKQKTFNLLRRVFKSNYDSTLVHIVNAMAYQPSTEDTFIALSEKAMAELLKHEAENIKLKAINSSLTAANNNLRHNDNNSPSVLKITRDSVFNRLKGLFPDNKAELIKELTDSFVDNKETKNRYHVTDAAELFSKDVDIYHYKNQIECLLHEAKVKSMKIVELEQQIADLHRKYTTPVITVGSVTPTTPKEPEFDSKTAIEHLRTLVALQETRLQRLEQKNEQETNKKPETLSMSETQPEEIKDTNVPEQKMTKTPKQDNVTWQQAEDEHLSKPVHSSQEITQAAANNSVPIHDVGDVVMWKFTDLFAAVKFAISSIETYSGSNVLIANLGEYLETKPEFVKLLKTYVQNVEKYNRIITIRGMNSCLDVLEYNTKHGTDYDYVPNPGSLMEPRYGWEHIDPVTGAVSFRNTPQSLSMSETQPEEIKDTNVPEPKITNGELTKLYDRLAALESWLSVRIAEHTEMIKTYAERAVFHGNGMFSIVKVAKLPNGRIPNTMYLVGEPDSDKFDLYVTDMNGELRGVNTTPIPTTNAQPTNQPGATHMSNSALIHNVETLYMSLYGHREIIDASVIARCSSSISDMFFAVERELAMRTDEAVRMLAHAGYKVNVSYIPIPDAAPLCTRMFQIGKDRNNLSFAFYDSIPVRSAQN